MKTGHPTETCPYCGTQGCEADWVDVEVGFQQCGPYLCENCGASSVGVYDKNELTEEEKRTGWYRAGKIGSTANTFMGVHVDHKTARRLYRRGLLDPKQ